MADTLNFELVSPERKLASVEAEAVTIPGMEGDLTAMANHAPFLTNLRPGYVVVRNGSSEDVYFVTGGFAEISDNTVSVLAEEAIEKATVNRAYIDEKIAGAEQALADATPARQQAAMQKLNDYKALLGQVPG
jgi:F-type H+-transporting ATPase subunit epsilon